MSNQVIDLDPTEHITVDGIGDHKQRTFLLQGKAGRILVTVVIDQEQMLALSIAGSELLEILEEEYSRELNQYKIPLPEHMALQAPLEPLFHAAQFQLGYDASRDSLVIITIELPDGPEFDPEALAVVRFWLTREQMVALVRKIDDVASSDLPICPACGEPLSPEGHQCLRHN